MLLSSVLYRCLVFYTNDVLEAVLYGGNRGPLPVEKDAYNVEAEGLEIGCLLGQVLFGHEADGVLLARGYGLQGVP